MSIKNADKIGGIIKGVGFILKFLLIFLVIAIAGGFLINQIPSWKQRVIEVVNPAAKEARLLGELTASLEELDKNIGDGENKGVLDKSRGILQNITDLNQKNSGIIRQQVGKIIDALIDRTPYPADHLRTPPINTPAICEPAK
ncbi:MAG: hypothetical protein HYX20_02395 [Candidatus Yanofskybacteria bacterium]|nr:hypothetical protein [Candidatus Yanofskybacteria bacterium]